MLSVISLFLCFSSYGQGFKKLSESEVDTSKKQIAHEFVTNYFKLLKEDSYYEFQDEEVIDALIKQLTEKNQKALYQQLKNSFGDFKSLEYAETWVQGNNISMQIFRFKSNFEKSGQLLELRVVLDESDKISGFWIKPWADTLN